MTSSQKICLSEGTKKTPTPSNDPDSYYLLITYTPREKEETDSLVFSGSDDPPEIISVEEEPVSNQQSIKYRKVLKINRKSSKEKSISIEFSIEEDYYTLTFEPKNKQFIYDLDLKVGRGKAAGKIKKPINQNDIGYYKKMEFFIRALQNKNISLLDTLYDETIDLYAKKLGFDFLISLFSKIYHKKDQCDKLLEIFAEKINDVKNMDRPDFLKNYLETIESVLDDSDDLIEKNSYNTIYFKGLLLSYINYYDFEKFTDYIKGYSPDGIYDLYNILILFYPQFKNPVDVDIDFLKKFIAFTAHEKNYDNLIKGGLTYCKNILTFLKVIDETKNEIIGINGFQPIPIDKRFLVYQIDDIKEMNKIVRSILQFSSNTNILLIYFMNGF